MTHHTLDYKQRLHKQGCRLTPQRQIILDTICAMDGHATANEIYARVHADMPAINRATVYRTLAFFCDLQVLGSGKIDGKTIYEIAAPTPHHHLVCRQCGQVDTLDNLHFEQLTGHLIAEHNFQPDINHLTISGLCANCQQGNKA